MNSSIPIFTFLVAFHCLYVAANPNTEKRTSSENPEVICSSTPAAGRRRRDVLSPCPAENEISPCVCDPAFNVLTCVGIEDEDHLKQIFQARYPLSKLTKVDIQRSNITALVPKAFGKVHIREFVIQNNPIRTVPKDSFAGSEASALYIILSHNEIDSFDWEAIRVLKSLRQLQLSHNRLTSIPDNAFGDLAKLDYVSLDNNRIRHVGKQVFSRLPSLTYLDLSNNLLNELGEFSFQFPTPSPDSVFPGPRLNIYLNSNNISKVDTKAFDGLAPNFLTLMQNKLQELSKDAIRPLLGKMAAAPGAVGIAVKGNNFICDCRTKWLLEEQKWLSLVRNFQCNDGRVLENMTLNDVKC